MTTPFYCLAVMLLLVVLTKTPVAIAQARSGSRGYDNRNPRTQQAELTGWGRRALAAHQNTFEALTIFTPAVLIAHLGGGPAIASQAATLALIHTGARVLYPIAYIADVHLARSLIWGVGFVSAVAMAFLPIFA